MLPYSVATKQSIQKILQSDTTTFTSEIKNGVQTFLRETQDDYELCLDILKNSEFINSDYFNLILRNTNMNNKELLKQYLKNKATIFKPKDGKDEKAFLNLLLSLNRNNPLPNELLINPIEQQKFIQKAIKAITNHSNNEQRAYWVILNGGRLGNNGLNKAMINKNFLDDWENVVHGRNYFKKFTNNMSMKSIANAVKQGEAFSINGEMYIKETNGDLTKLGYNEKVYERLFPPIDRFNTCQGQIGDCYFVTLLNTLMDKPEGRNKIYKMFKGSTEQQILISKNPNKYIPYKFKEFDSSQRHVYNNNAFAIIEQYAAKNKAGKKQFNTVDELMRNFNAGNSSMSLRYVLDIPLDKTINTSVQDESSLIQLLKKEINSSDTIFTFGTKPKASQQAESLLNEKYDIFSEHAYAIKGFNPETNTVTISNPHYCAIETEIPIHELFQYVGKDGITASKFV